VHPATGVHVVFRRTADDTNGRAVIFEMFVPPNGGGFATHVHPRQEERVEVLHGTMGVRVGRQRTSVGPGGRVTVPAGTAHGLWNAGVDVAHVVCELRPALRFDSLLEAMFALAAEGEKRGCGRPKLLQRAVIAHAHLDTVRAASPPAWVQRLGLGVAARIGRLLGHAYSDSTVAKHLRELEQEGAIEPVPAYLSRGET
jgi:mannose-6-phosphate isomerase-like protein (cupin superfamily)